MNSSKQLEPSLDELQQVRAEADRAASVDELRDCFNRLRALRHAFADDFDASLRISELQDYVLERARQLRGGAAASAVPIPTGPEIPPDVERLNHKDWQRVIYIGLFFAVLLFAAFFYLIQTARRLNLTPVDDASKRAPAATSTPKSEPVQNTGDTPATPAKPAVRVYTDLVPGTVSIDDQAPSDLKDGELTLDDLQPGRHTIKINGRNGSAQFSYEVSTDGVPSIVGAPSAANVLAALVETGPGHARMVTSAQTPEIAIDGNVAGQAGDDGLDLKDLGKSDHLLQVTDGKDRQRFVLTYTPAPTLTVYVKSDPNAGIAVLETRVDGADVYINDNLYRRKTDAGQLRIPLNAGDYTIRVHKAGYIDPPPATVSIKKAEETAVTFRMEPVPQIATLQVKGAAPGTMVYIDRDFAVTASADGSATVPNVKPGVHTIELRRDQALSKRFERSFKAGDIVTLSGPDAVLERAVTDAAAPAPAPAPVSVNPASTGTAQDYSMQMDGPHIRKGGGFVAYHVPRVPGHYTFAGQTRLGGLLKHGKLEWYAGYQDSKNYILFSVDGKHATVRAVQNGEERELGKIPFEADSKTWIQVDMTVKPDMLDARIKTPDRGWSDLGSIPSQGRDFTQGRVGFYVPDKDEIAVSNFRFSAHQ